MSMARYSCDYCKSWFWAKKHATNILTEEQARKAHNERERYTVLVNSTERPYAVIDVVGGEGFVGVTFLDEVLRESLSYNFKEIEAGKLFLSMATHREFFDDKDQVRLGTSYVFNQDGGLIITKESFEPHTLKEARSTTDVSGNYEDYPNFGEYDHLLEADRG